MKVIWIYQWKTIHYSRRIKYRNFVFWSFKKTRKKRIFLSRSLVLSMPFLSPTIVFIWNGNLWIISCQELCAMAMPYIIKHAECIPSLSSLFRSLVCVHISFHRHSQFLFWRQPFLFASSRISTTRSSEICSKAENTTVPMEYTYFFGCSSWKSLSVVCPAVHCISSNCVLL